MGNWLSNASTHASPSAGWAADDPLMDDLRTSMRVSKSKLVALVKANHLNYSLLYKNDHFHNALAHHLGAAYLFGAPPSRLFELYEVESKNLEPWKNSPAEITKIDWNRYFGEKEYLRAYLDYFEDEVVRNNYDWKRVIQRYLVEGDDQLITGLISGDCHSLIHIGYAYELNNVELATEGLALACVDRDFLHKYVEAKIKYKAYSILGTGEISTESVPVLELLNMIRVDTTFDPLFDKPGYWNLPILFASNEELVLDYYNKWNPQDAAKDIEELLDVTVLLLVGTNSAEANVGESEKKVVNFDFFLLPLLEAVHAGRIMMKYLPPSCHSSLVEALLFVIMCHYITELRPAIRTDIFAHSSAADIDGNKATKTNDWRSLRRKCMDEAVNGDPHFIRAIRCLMEAELAFGYKNGLYSKAASLICEFMESYK